MSIRNPYIGTLVMILGIFIIARGIYSFFTEDSSSSMKIFRILIMPLIGGITTFLGYIYSGERKIIVNKDGIKIVYNIGQMGHLDWDSIMAISNGKEFVAGYYIKIIEEKYKWIQFEVGYNKVWKNELMYIFNEIVKKRSKYKFRVIDKENWNKSSYQRTSRRGK